MPSLPKPARTPRGWAWSSRAYFVTSHPVSVASGTEEGISSDLPPEPDCLEVGFYVDMVHREDLVLLVEFVGNSIHN